MKLITIIIICLSLVACGASQEQAEKSTPSYTTREPPLSATITSSPVPTKTIVYTVTSTIAPTNTAVASQTPTFTTPPAAISSENIEQLRLTKRWGKKNSFTHFKKIVLSPNGNYLAISGDIDDIPTCIVYETENFGIVATFVNTNNLAWSADESQLALSMGTMIEIRDFQTDELTQTIDGFPVPIKSMVMDGGKIAAVDSGNSLKILDSTTGQELFHQQLPLNSQFNTDVMLHWSNGGKYLAIVGIDEIVRVWDGEQIREFVGHLRVVDSASWSPEGDLLATSSSQEPNEFVWRMSNSNQVFNFAGNRFWVSNITWSPDGLSIASADAEGTITVRNSSTGGVRSQFTYFYSPDFITWSPDSNYIAASYDDSIKIHEIHTQVELEVPDQIIKGVSNLNWLAGSERILLANQDARLQLWNIKTGEIKMIIDPIIGKAVNFAYSPDGEKFALAERGGNVQIVDSIQGEVLTTIDSNFQYSIRNLVWSNDQLMIASSDFSTIRVFDANSGDELQILSGSNLGSGLKIAWSPTEPYLLIGNEVGDLYVWDAQSSQIIKRIELHDSSVMDVVWSQDGSKIAAAGIRGEIYIWDTQSWKREAVFQSFTDFMIWVDLAFSTEFDSIFICSTGIDDFIPPTFSHSRYQIWDIQSQEILHEWNGDWSSNIALSPDGTMLASSNGDIWDTKTGNKLHTLNVAGSQFDNIKIAWSPDGRNLVFPNETIDFWGISP